MISFSSQLEEKTNQLILKHFSYKLDSNSILYHFTNAESAQKIVQHQEYWASFIRSTSDTLEFALPLSYCRDWLCFEKKLFDFSSSGFPTNLFTHFNQQAIDPIVRYYFISLTEKHDSTHHLSNYGQTAINFEFGKPPEDLKDFLMILKCRYASDLKVATHTLLDEWQAIFYEVLNSLNLNPAQVKLEDWFYMFMRFAHMCSLCIKQSAFNLEEEVRIIYVPYSKSYDSAQKYSGPRSTLKVSDESLLVREYLPLKLHAMGIKVSILEK